MSQSVQLACTHVMCASQILGEYMTFTRAVANDLVYHLITELFLMDNFCHLINSVYHLINSVYHLINSVYHLINSVYHLINMCIV